MGAKHRGGASGRDRIIHGPRDRCPLGHTRHRAEQVRARQQRGDRQRDRMRRDVGKGGKTAIVDLLAAARIVELDRLDRQWVVKVGDGRIVEREVAVLTDAEADDVDRSLAQQLSISAALGIDRVAAVDQVDDARPNAVEQVAAQVSTEPLRRGLR